MWLEDIILKILLSKKSIKLRRDFSDIFISISEQSNGFAKTEILLKRQTPCFVAFVTIQSPESMEVQKFDDVPISEHIYWIADRIVPMTPENEDRAQKELKNYCDLTLRMKELFSEI